MLRSRTTDRYSKALHRISGLFLLGLVMGCHARRPDVAAEATRLIGLQNAITFRQDAEQNAPGPDSDQVLTIEHAIRLTLANDPRIQASLARVRVAEADANQVRLLPNPIMTIDFRFPVAAGSNTAFEPTLAADLVSLLQKPAQISAADHRLRESAANALVTVLDVMAEVQEAYAAARSVEVEIENARHRLQRIQWLRDLAQKRLDLGEGIRLDVLTLDSQFMQSTLDISDFGLQRVEQQLTLVRLIGQPRSDVYWKLFPWEPPPGNTLAAESRWIDAAMRNRPEICSRIWELKALGDDLAGAAIPPLQGGEVGVHAERDPDWRVGPVLTIPLPLFDFGQAARERLKALRSVARHELAQQQLDVIQGVRLAYASYLHSRETLTRAQEKLLPLQRRQLDQAQRAYQAGEVDLATLLLAQNETELTLSKILELQEKVTVARIKLQRAAGGAGVADRLDTAAAAQPAGNVVLPPISAVPLAEPTTQPSTSRPAAGPPQ